MFRRSLIPILLVSHLVLAQSDLELINTRRQADLAQFPNQQQIDSIPIWLSTQQSDGTWSDVNYLAGCDAQRANWPIQNHWIRIISLAVAWSGVNPAIPSNYTADQGTLNAALKGLDYWFANDYTTNDCIGQGGLANATCPCGTPGLWNTNWFDQVILIPQLCSTACLLLSSANLTETQRAGCERIPLRAYSRRDEFINGLGYLTGANTINVMQNSVSLALYTNNETILADAFSRAMGVVQFDDEPRQDGIHRDGSFLQHNGILYNGNYGKDLLNAFIQLEGEAIGTTYAANDSTRNAFATDIRGSEWMIYVDQDTKQEHWDFNVIGRFVAFPTPDLQASADINFNVSKLAAAAADFEGANDISDTVRRLESNGTEKLVGNKGFWASDYMVHRRENFILGNKMVSHRSVNTETTNGANSLGYHMGQGTLFSYVTGTEYKDIMGAWDWNLVPGSTVLLDYPKLNAKTVGVNGKTDFVGMASDGWVGTAVEDYVDPHDASLAYHKAWFYLDESVIVITTDIAVNASSNVTAGTPVVTVLDNRAAVSGGLFVDGEQVDASDTAKINGTTLYYGGNGYLSYEDDFQLTLSEGDRSGNWSAISTSTVGVQTVPIFSAYTTISGSAHAYAFWPAVDKGTLESEALAPSTVPIYGDGVSGVAGVERLSLVFWPKSKEVSFNLSTIGWADKGTISVASQQPAIHLFATRCNDDGTRTLVITVSDPTQKLSNLVFSFQLVGLQVSCSKTDWNDGCSERPNSVIKFSVRLPSDGYAGSSVFKEVVLA